MEYPRYIQYNGFERSLEENSDAILLSILDIALKHNHYEIPPDVQDIILYFTPFSNISDTTQLITSIESYPMKPPNLERVDDILILLAQKPVRKRVADILNKKIEHVLTSKKHIMHPFWYYIASYSYYRVYNDKIHERSKQLFLLLRQLLIYGRSLDSEEDFIKDSDDTLPTNYGAFDSAETKRFACALLSHWYQRQEKQLKQIAEDALTQLEKPLNKIYNELLANKSPILTLKLSESCLCSDKSIVSQREAMKEVLPDILSWYLGKPYVQSYAQEQEIKSFFDKMGLTAWDRVVKVAQKAGTNRLRKADVVMMLYRLIAESINDDFQACMLKLYTANRKTMGLGMPSYHPLCKLVSPPIKTISRARFKVKEDYKRKDEKPEEGSVLDWVRCAIIVESDIEMKNFFDLLCKEYAGCIIRMKNKFSADCEAHYGYRVCMVNMLWTNKDNPKLKMIVEVQLILHSYLPIRSKMHLFYKISRSESWRAMADDFAKFSDI